LVFGSGEAVDHEGPADQVEVLPAPTDRVGSAKVEGVFEAAVDGLGVGPQGEDPFEVGIAGRDWSQVLGSVQFSFRAVSLSLPWSRTVRIWLSSLGGSR
jgi:hypothetical protein